MNFKESAVSTQPEILKRRLGGELFEPITLASDAFTNGVWKAGQPIAADGKAVNGASSDGKAVGILLTDTYSERPIGTIVKAFACVNLANANANAGITIADAVKTALPLIVFE